MSEYTPTTEEVRERYWFNDGGLCNPDDAKEFDRWFAEEVRKAKADAFKEGYKAGWDDLYAEQDWDPWASNPYERS